MPNDEDLRPHSSPLYPSVAELVEASALDEAGEWDLALVSLWVCRSVQVWA